MPCDLTNNHTIYNSDLTWYSMLLKASGYAHLLINIDLHFDKLYCEIFLMEI